MTQIQIDSEAGSAKDSSQSAQLPKITASSSPPVTAEQLRLSLLLAQKKQAESEAEQEHFGAETFKSVSRDHMQAQELQRLATRELPQVAELGELDAHYFIVDDLLREVSQATDQLPLHGWIAVSNIANPLGLPAVVILTAADQLRARKKLGLQPPVTLASYVLSRLGLCCYSAKGSEIIGTAASFLFVYYFLEHLKLTKRFTALPIIPNLDHEFMPADTIVTVQATRELEATVKRKVYQLAYFCAEVSKTRVDRLTLQALDHACASELDRGREQQSLHERLKFGL